METRRAQTSRETEVSKPESSTVAQRYTNLEAVARIDTGADARAAR